RANLDPVRASVNVQPLKHAVKTVDYADVVPVDINRRVVRFHFQAEGAFIPRVVVVLRIARVTAVPRVVIAAVVPSVVAAEPERAVAPRIVVAAVIAAGNEDGAATAVGRRNRPSGNGLADWCLSV